VIAVSTNSTVATAIKPCFTDSVAICHLGKNPSKGGTPARDLNIDIVMIPIILDFSSFTSFMLVTEIT